MIKQLNEYDRLKQVIVCPPQYMEIKKIINETQKFYEDENIDIPIALKQHQHFIDTLRKHQVNVLELPADPNLNEQVFTRDIGFTIGDTLYTAEMSRDIRKAEVNTLQRVLDEHQIPYSTAMGGSIEGGDVVVAGDLVWVGVSKRTEESAIAELQKRLPDRQVIPLPIREDILHLDCCFNLVSETTGLIYPQAFSKEDLSKLRQHYDLIEVSEEEQFSLGTNVFSIGEYKVISLPVNKQVNQNLTDKGFVVIEVDFSEIIKSGGSFRCCTFPIERG
ncbi:dimethylarginine dimethylaminohydrolase family protein [Gracilibacillus salinarum]|uniref:Arginine deiminase family protein n=1 Tax=Gracilibacillus salinarum TaxID=2932255 RepID=A0ABY4GK48_9BACI|nr:arginine deiminase family protein [Gracilibacillus salinarum]UOQ84573.1 arginine deiminase family protein [Gracilibacillus salinarum]